jgi:raffinose/stachyose/melibiose transport system substrate-binding protein
MKKSFAWFAVFILFVVMVLSGCSGSGGSNTENTPSKETKNSESQNQNTQKPSEAPPKEVTLTLWNRLQTDLFNATIEGFQKKYPHINVKLVNLPQAGGEAAQYQAAINGKELPDMFVRPTTYTLAQLKGLNVLHSLNEVFPKGEYDQYTAGTFSEGISMINGQVYQFPLFSALHGSAMLYYNKKVLDQLGIKEADIPRTWDKFMELGKEIYKKSNGKIYGMIFGGATNYMDLYVVNSNANAISPESGMDFRTGQYNYATPGVIETFQFFKKAYKDKVLHPSTIDGDTGKAYSTLHNGEVAFMVQGNWGGSYLINDKFTANDWGVVPLPTKSGNDAYQYFEGGSGEHLYVNQDTKNWPEVKLFLNYMKDNIYSNIVKTGSTLPSKKMEYVKEASMPFPQYKTISDIMTKAKVLTPSVFIHNTDANDVLKNFVSYLPKDNLGALFLAYLQGQIPDSDLDGALKKYNETYNKALDKAIENSKGKVKREDFIFKDWVPGKDYAASK